MSIISFKKLLVHPVLRASVRRLGATFVILLVIAYLALFGLIVGERGKAGLPAQPVDAAVEALRRSLDYVVNHPETYNWHKQDVPAAELVLALFGRSAGLLLTALAIAAMAGVPLGIAAALLRRVRAAPLVLLLSVLGVSTPSFLLAMLFWVVNVLTYRWMGLDKALLPPTGFGWDAHIVMPALVLATRPLAQIVHITYVSLSNVLGEDYIRTAQAKGLSRRVVINRHAMRNILIPTLTTLSTSLRFSLASLPVVESFFLWPGVGLTLLQTIEAGPPSLVIDLIVSLGFLFLMVNAGLDVIYQLVDPRLREAHTETQLDERRTWRERWGDLKYQLVHLASQILKLGRRQPAASGQPAAANLYTSEQLFNSHAAEQVLPTRRRPSWWLLRSIGGNLPLLVGTLLVAALCVLAVLGESWSSADPYETHGVMVIEGKIGSPPYAPSSVFPWGSDTVGRDIQSLVLSGAKQTLTLACLAMLARMLVGAVLGVLAGWWRNSWLDRAVNGVVAVWAAFPVTLFAMIVILALGIQQGVKIFVIALCVVGWGEIAQFVRGQVISLKPQPYIEAARTVGARSGWILTRHVLPHLWAPLLVLAVAEMGSVLMLLAELGFLNIFLGGGYRVEIGESGFMVPLVYYFSDVPEWGALLANIRGWWRSYPWLAWYPGAAFFIAILAFNVWGEGLRRLLEDTRVNLGRLVNRYTVIALALVVFGGGWLVRSTTPLEMYKEQAQQFDVQRAMEHVKTLSSTQFYGRESGTSRDWLAANYVAQQMKDIGLLPAGEKESYVYGRSSVYTHLDGAPRLEILGANSAPELLTYRQDFVEFTTYSLARHTCEGTVVGLALGPEPGDAKGSDPYNLASFDLYGKIVLVRQAGFERLASIPSAAGVLIVSDDPATFERRYLFPLNAYSRYLGDKLVMYITPQAAERLLAPGGGSLAQLDTVAKTLQAGRAALSGEGAQVRLSVPTMPENLSEKSCYVVGYIPGTGAAMKDDTGSGLDNRVILVSAYYDGLGAGPDGTIYPGANDNASGVAALLEIARSLAQSSYRPQKTIVFVAWSGGERGAGLSVKEAMSAKRGFNLLTVETVIELSGVGAGSGNGIALGQGTSFSLVQLFQDAASRVGVSVTTRGRGPHFGQFIRPGFGGRSALSAYVSWDGSDRFAHTPQDTFETIDPDKLKQSSQLTLLVLNALGQAESQASEQGALANTVDYIQGARMFDETQALKHVDYLASDQLEGRRTGTPGGQAAGDYIAARFAEYGLQPGGTADTYFQPFTVPYTTLVKSPLLTAFFQDIGGETTFTRTYTYRIDYIPIVKAYFGSGEAKGQLVWLNKCRGDDFGNQRVDGKIALCHAPSDGVIYDEMVGQLRQHRMAGVVLIAKTQDDFLRPSYRSSVEPVTIPALQMTEPAARDLIAGAGHAWDALSRRALATPLSVTVHMDVAFQTHEVKARNVLGLLPGADPAHKDEIVVIGAHYDHMGRDPDGTIYNGADDNATGVAVVLEIARLWRAQGFRPARSVLFAAWDDEEQGLVGSKYYVQNATYPLAHTVAMIGLDMVGVGEELHIDGTGSAADQLLTSAKVYSTTVFFDNVPPAGSDHAPFYEASVPATLLVWFGPQVDPVYHKPGDDVQVIQPQALRAAGVLCAHALAAWSGGGPAAPLPNTGPQRTLRDLILPTPTCAPPWPIGAMTCDHGQWSR